MMNIGLGLALKLVRMSQIMYVEPPLVKSDFPWAQKKFNFLCSLILYTYILNILNKEHK